MWIDVIPYKVTEDSLMLRTAATNPLRPGQILSFEDSEGHRLYGKITQIDQAPVSPTDVPAEIKMIQQVSVSVIYGEPSFTMRQARVLSMTETASELVKINGQIEYPLKLADVFETNILKIGTLTIIDGDGLDPKLNTLHHLIEGLKPYQQLIVIDPLGVINHPQAHVIRAGLDVSLSLRDIGLKRFLTALDEVLPERAMDEAEPILAHELSANQTFFAFKTLHNADDLKDAFFKTTLQEAFSDIERQRVFADVPKDVLSLHNILQDGLTILDLSALSEPWKTLFYETAMMEALSNADADLIPILLYPENYLTDLPSYIKKANEAELAVVMMASPYAPQEIQTIANNRLTHIGDGVIQIEGSLTFGLPVHITLPDFYETSHYKPGWATAEQAATLYPPYTPPPDTGVYTPPQEGLKEAQKAPEPYSAEPAPSPPPPPAAAPEQPAPPPQLAQEAAPGFDSILGDEAFEFDFDASKPASTPVAPDMSAPMDDDFDFSSDLLEIEAELHEGITPTPATSVGYSSELPPEIQAQLEGPPDPIPGAIPVVRQERPAQNDDNPDAFKVGDKVQHEKYGVGVVNKVIPMDNNMVLNISFEQGGKRLMDPKLAHLERVS